MTRNTTIKSAGVLVLVLGLVAGMTLPAMALTGLTADFNIGEDDPHAGEDITFDAALTTNVSDSATYGWDFDDDGDFTDASGQIVDTNFSAGDHDVSLIVEDPDDGTNDTKTKTVSVREVRSYSVEVTANQTGSAAALSVNVGNESQDHDLTADGAFTTTLAESANVIIAQADDEGSLTGNAVHTVGEGNATALSVGDATIDVTESEVSDGGSGSPGAGSGGGIGLSAIINHWLTQSIIAAFVVYYVFRALELRGDD